MGRIVEGGIMWFVLVIIVLIALARDSEVTDKINELQNRIKQLETKVPEEND